MSTRAVSRVSEVLPAEAWTALEQNSRSVLVDVRTEAEWNFVGVPDVSELGRETVFVEWAKFPNMSNNPEFVDQVKSHVARLGASHVFFLCRSGVRSLKAAAALSDAVATIECINVAEGFEGDLDEHQRRGGLNGWKARGLPWRQS